VRAADYLETPSCQMLVQE